MASGQTLLVFPTSVGMNRVIYAHHAGKMGVPHERGDEPATQSNIVSALVCSPRAWG